MTNVGAENATLIYGPPLFDLMCCPAEGHLKEYYLWSDGAWFIHIVLELRLEPGENHTETLEWDLRQYKEGEYFLPEPGKYLLGGICRHAEAFTNPLAKIAVTYSSDLNKDLKVDILDIHIVAAVYYTRPSDEKWNAISDLNQDGIVNILDVFAVARDFGRTI
jgi:hypothetical protein